MKKTSLFTKFTVLIFYSAIIVLVTTHGVLHLYFNSMRSKLPLREGFYQFSKYIVGQIDINDTVSAIKLLRDQGLEMRFRGDNFEWASSRDVPNIESIDSRISNQPAFWYHKRLVSKIENGRGTYILQSVNLFEQLSFPWGIILVWSAILIFIFCIAHLRIRCLLKPVRILQNGVKQISTGHFDIQLPQTTSDELGLLIHSFNNMARHIHNDIKARDQLLRDISHELRSPLARMLVALEFVPEGNIRQTLKNNITVLEKMTSTILEEERLDSPYGKVKPEKIDLGNLLSDIVDSRKQNSPPVVLKSGKQVQISVDLQRMRMAISNVIDNAIKYSKPDSMPIVVSYNNDDYNATISICDNGIGISEKELPFIFEPFYRVDKARSHNSGGYGLGMSLTKKIVEAHNGSISIVSYPDKGTTVTIALPL